MSQPKKQQPSAIKSFLPTPSPLQADTIEAQKVPVARRTQSPRQDTTKRD